MLTSRPTRAVWPRGTAHTRNWLQQMQPLVMFRGLNEWLSRAVDEADDGYDPIEFAEEDDDF